MTDSRLLIDGLLKLTEDELRFLLAFQEVNLADALMAKINDFLNKSGDGFRRKIQEHMDRLQETSREEMILRILLHINRELGIGASYNYVSPRDLEDNARDIVRELLSQMRCDNKEFNGTSLNDIMLYQVEKLFQGFGKRFQKMSRNEQEKVEEEVNQFIGHLSIQEQKKLEKALGVEELSADTIRNALASGTLGIGLAALVEMSGFAFYTTMSSLLASIAGAVGITLPFGTYVMISSVIAVLTSPLFLALFIFWGGSAFYKHQNGKLRRQLMPLLVTVIALASQSEKESLDAHRVINYWKEEIQAYRRLQAKLNQLEIERADLDEKIRSHEKLKESYQEVYNQYVEKAKRGRQSLANYLEQHCFIIKGLKAHSIFSANVDRFFKVIEEIKELEKQKYSGWGTDLLDKARGVYHNLRISFEISALQKEKQSALCMLIKTMEQVYQDSVLPVKLPPEILIYIDNIMAIEKEARQSMLDTEGLMTIIREEKKNLSEINTHISDIRKKIKEADKRFSNLAEIARANKWQEEF